MKPKGMLSPHSLMALLWSYSVLIFDFIYLPFILPALIAFVCDNATKDIVLESGREITLQGGEGAGWLRAWNWLAGCIYLVDIVFKLNTGIVVAGPGQETVVIDRQYVTKRYLNPLVGGPFIIDLISVLPFVYEICITFDTIGDQGDQVLNILRLLRLLYVIRFSIWIYMKALSGYYPSASLWDRIPNMALLCGILMHTILGTMSLMACTLFAIARWEGEQNSWVAGRDGAVDDGYHIDTPLLDATQWRKYLDSMFWAMDTWTTVGFGNPAPIRWVEQIMVLLIEYLYIFFFSLTAGLFGNVLSRVHEFTTPAEFREKMGNVAAWMDSRKLSYGLRMKVKLFYLGLWSKESGFYAADFLAEIPEDTRNEIVNIKAEPVVRDATFLKELSSDIRGAIASKIMPKSVAAGDSLFVEGGAADSIFIIESGYARITSSSGGIHDVGRSQVVGLSALFAPSCPPFSKRLTTPIAMNNCELWEIKVSDLPDPDRLASRAWAFLMKESDSLATEFGVSAGLENKKKAAKVNLTDGSFNEFATDILKQRASSPVLTFKPVVEGMYDPTTLGLFQPSQKLLRVDAVEWGRYVEDARKHGNSGVLINPTSKFSVYWTWFMAIFDLVFAVCVLPQIIQFVIDNDPKEAYPLAIVPEGSDQTTVDYTHIKDSHTWGRALLWIAGVIYFLDMVSGFITGFVVSHSNKALAIKDPSKVFKYYLTKGGFLVDLVSVIPFIYEICAVRDVPGDEADQILNILRLFARYGRVYWILKEIYINSVINHWSIPTYPFFDWVQPTFVYFGYVIYTLFGVINWIGALMYVVARWRGLDESWVAHRIHLPREVKGIVENDGGANCLNCYSLLGGDVGHGPSEWEHWVGGIFYGIDILLTNGNGEPHPVTWNEEIAALIVMVFQVYYFGFVIGATLDLFKSSRNVVERADANQLKMKAMESFFLTRRLPRHLQVVIQSFYTEVWSRIVDFDEAEILERLPSSIRGEVVYGMLAPVYKKMELFERFTPDVLLSVSSMLKPSLCSREAKLYAEGDPAHSLYVVEFGNVVATENGVNRAKIQGPSTIGEEIISVRGEETEARRDYTVESESSCFLWLLDAISLDAVDEKHPGTKETLQMILSGMHVGTGNVQGSPLKKRTSSLRRVMSKKSVGTLNDAYFSEPLPPMAYQPKSFDVSSAEWFRLMSVPESERKSKFIINPHTLVALYSSWFMFAFDAIYTAFVMPALVAFVLVDNDDLLPGWAFALEIIAGLIFIGSMALNMTTGYIAQYDHRSTVVMRRKDVLVHYVWHGGFLTDVLSILPFFYEIIARAEGSNENAQLTLSILRMLRIFRVFRVLRLIWNVSFSVSTKQLGWMLRAPDGIGRILKAPTLLWMFNIFYVFMFFSNFCGSVLYILGKAESSEGAENLGDRSWIAMRIMPTEDGELLFDNQRIMRYLHSVYWAMDTLGTVGFGDPWPNTWQEDLASMLVMFIAVLLFSVIFASTSTIIKSLREDVRKLDALRTRMKEVIKWMDDRGFTSGLKKVVRSYYSDKLSSANNLDVEVLMDMPDGIRSSVLQYVTQDVMNHLDLFKNIDRYRKEMIAGCLTPVTVASGHDLYERDDLPSGIYLLEGGTLDAFRGSEEIGRVSGWATIGDYALVQTREPHPVTVRAKTACYLWHLEMSALEELYKDDSTLMIELIGGQEQQMRTAWARTDGGFLDTRVGGEEKGTQPLKPMLGRSKSRYSLRNVARYHEVSSAKWGTLFTGAEDYSASKEEEYHKANLVAKRSGLEVPLSPDHPLAIFWSGKMMIMDATYTSFLLPVVICFGLGRDYNPTVGRSVDLEWWVHLFEWYAGLVFIVNMFMNMATGFVAQNNNQKVIVMGLKPVFENYIMRGTFIIDILSIIPFFMYFGVLGGADGGGAKHAYTWLLLLRFVPRFLFFLMDLASTCFAGNNALPVIVDYTPNSTFYFMLTIYMTALTLNVLGCFYFFAAVWRKTRPDDSWLSNRDLDLQPALDASLGLQYLDSIYWCSDTLTTVGYGDPQPTTWEEMLVAMVIMVFNIYFFILIESAISELLRDTAENEEFRKMKASKRNWVLGLMKYWGVADDTQRQVIHYYEEKWTKTKAFDEDVLMGELPNTVRSQVAVELKS